MQTARPEAPEVCHRRALWGTLAAEGVTTVAKPKKAVFSVTKAVKANARERLGTPPSEKVLPNSKDKAAIKPKHKETLADLLAEDKES